MVPPGGDDEIHSAQEGDEGHGLPEDDRPVRPFEAVELLLLPGVAGREDDDCVPARCEVAEEREGELA